MALPQDDPRLGDYLAMARRQWLTIAAVTALVVVVAALVTSASPVERTASTLVSLRSATQPLPLEPGTTPDVDISLELAVARSDAVVERAKEALDGAETAGDAAQVGDAPLLMFTASDADAERAVRAADAYASAYVDVRNEQIVSTLEAGLASVEQRLTSLSSPAAAGAVAGESVDAAELERLRRAADLLGEAATSGQLAAVEAAAEEVRGAASASVSGDALLLVRRTALQQLSDELTVALQAQRAAGPSIAVPATADDATGGFARTLPLALVVGLALGAGVGLLRELRDGTVHRAAELPERTSGAPFLGDLEAPGGADALRAAVLLALPDGGVVQVAPVGSASGAEVAAAEALVSSLSSAQRDVAVVDARPDLQPVEGVIALDVPVGHRDFAASLAATASRGRLVLVLSPPAARGGDALLVAAAADAAVLAVVPGQDGRASTGMAAAVLRNARLGLLGSVVTSSRTAGSLVVS